jgi:hypothetical protein
LRTPQEILNIAKISLYLAQNDKSKGALYGQRLDPDLGRKIYMEYESLQWLIDNDPSNANIGLIANYVYELSNAYTLEAIIIAGGDTGGGSITPITPSEMIYPFVITGADFESDGITYNDSRIIGDELMLFITGFNQEWQFAPTFFTYTSTGFIIVAPGFDANNFGNIIVQNLNS